MKDIIDEKTLEAIQHYGDAATNDFLARLQEHRFMSTRCSRCEHLAFPPRGHCPKCLSREVSWVDLPTQGTVYAFSQQSRTFRFMRPDVIGLVELPEVGRIMTRFDAPFDALSIGQPVELDFYEVCDKLTVHQFRPTGA